jgi:hypothetical protein
VDHTENGLPDWIATVHANNDDGHDAPTTSDACTRPCPCSGPGGGSSGCWTKERLVAKESHKEEEDHSCRKRC